MRTKVGAVPRVLNSPLSSREIDSWYELVRACAAHDLPPGVPLPGRAETAGRLRVPPMDSVRELYLAVPGGRGVYDGVAALWMTDDGSGGERRAFIPFFAVLPGRRRGGVGKRMWEVLRAALEADGRRSVEVLAEPGSGDSFARGRGFTEALALRYHTVDLGGPRPEPAALPPGYRAVSWTGFPPDRYAEGYARARGAMADAPAGDLHRQTHRWTAERVRDAVRVVLDRGGVMLSLAVLDEGGAVAAYTEVVLPQPDSVRAVQYDTVVVPGHRGLGLGRAVKLRMERLLRETHRRVRQIETTVADDNAPMLAVNGALGYRAERSVALHRARL